MVKRLALASVLWVALLAAACGDDPGPAPGDASKDEAPPRDAPQVLNALVAMWYEEPFIDERSRALLLRSHTWSQSVTGDSWARTREQLPSLMERLRPDTLEAFERANATPLDLREVLRTRHTVHFVDVKVLKETVGSSRNSHEYDVAMRKLLGQYPDSRQLVSLSVPGVSPDGTQALVYGTETLGARVAAGFYFLLAWQDGAWRIVTKHVAWVS
jgi:hypothetical protein